MFRVVGSESAATTSAFEVGDPELEPTKLFGELTVNPAVYNAIYHHSLRVMYISSQLGRQLGIGHRNLEIAALLHDIGKVAIASEILLKPGPLKPLEYFLVQGHCHTGNVICRNVLGNDEVARFVRDHHERWDGKGYPRGLSGHAIPIEARIISACDVFDALVFEERPYSTKRWSPIEALDELQRCAWTQFDGDVVSVFKDLILSRPQLFASKPDLESEAKLVLASAC